MSTAPTPTVTSGPHTASRAQFEAILSYLDGAEAAGLEHFELESWLAAHGQQLLRQLMQEHFDLRALWEVRLQGVVDAQGVVHASVEPDHAGTAAWISLRFAARGSAPPGPRANPGRRPTAGP
jgi:hypothetical protein